MNTDYATSRKIFIFILLSLFLFCHPYIFIRPELSIIKGPYLQNVTPHSITIMWETTRSSSSMVKYGFGENLDLCKEDKRPVRIHEVKIENLETQRVYHYQVISEIGSERVESRVYTFKTAPYRDTPFRFVVWGDNRTNCTICEKVCRLIASQEPDIVINVGDVVTDGRVYEQWGREYFLPISHFAPWVPSYIAIGNHERGSRWFDVLVSQPGNEHWFSFDYGNSHFIILDTNKPYEPGSEQYRWLEENLGSKNCRDATFRFAFFHHPPYSEQWHLPGYDGEQEVREYLVPLLESYGVDLVFSGHTHDYERGKKVLENGGEIYYIITGGGGAPLDRVFTKDWEHMGCHLSVYHYCVVDVRGDELEFKAIGVDGEIIDSFTINKN